MKKIITFIIINSFLFSGGSVYLGVDIQNQYDFESDFLNISVDSENNIEKEFILIGYDHSVYREDQFGLDIGFNIFAPILFISVLSEDDNSNSTLGLEVDSNNEAIYSLYIKSHIYLTKKKKLDLWINFGYMYPKYTHGKQNTSSIEYFPLKELLL